MPKKSVSFNAGDLVVECSLTVRKVMGSIQSYLKTVKVGTRCIPAKNSALKGRIEGKWCKKNGDWSGAHPYRKVAANEKRAFRVALDKLAVDKLTYCELFKIAFKSKKNLRNPLKRQISMFKMFNI